MIKPIEEFYKKNQGSIWAFMAFVGFVLWLISQTWAFSNTFATQDQLDKIKSEQTEYVDAKVREMSSTLERMEKTINRVDRRVDDIYRRR